MNPEELKAWVIRTEKMVDDDLQYIPPHMHEGLKLYVLNGVPPGGFLEAVLANDFKTAAGRADRINSKYLKEWALVVANAMPRAAQGSYENVHTWIEEHPTR